LCANGTGGLRKYTQVFGPVQDGTVVHSECHLYLFHLCPNQNYLQREQDVGRITGVGGGEDPVLLPMAGGLRLEGLIIPHPYIGSIGVSM